MQNKFPFAETLARLPLPATEKWKEGVWDVEVHKKGNVRMIFFAPRGTDYQTSHEEEEYYFIVSGRGELVIADERLSFGPGDAFYVPANVPHRFEKFSDDFACWAVFF
jgi:mannose-6-phosphate isomerase-like protein (cupin superfamily)